MTANNEQPHIRILAIAPYEGMNTALQHAAEAYPQADFDIFIADLDAALVILEAHDMSIYDCIISRDGAAGLLRNKTSFPVVEIPISIYDVFRTIKLAENYTKRYVIVGFQNITEPTHTLSAPLGLGLDIFTTAGAEEVPAALKKLQRDGYHMVVCDIIAHTTARQLGLGAFLITSGTESIHTAIDQALTLSAWFVRLCRENTLLKSVTKGQGAFVAAPSADASPFYSSATEFPGTPLQKLCAVQREVPRNDTLRFYHSDRGEFFHITAKQVFLDRTERTLFYCTPSRIPLHRRDTGIWTFSKGECEFLFPNSSYSLSGAMGLLGMEVKALARLQQSLLILGERDTGKEQVARYLYLRSLLANNPLVVVDYAEASDKSRDFLLDRYDSSLCDSGNTVYFQNLERIPEARGRALLSTIKNADLSRRVRLFPSAAVADNAPVSEMTRLFSERLGCMSLRLPSLRNRADEIPSLASLYPNNLSLEFGRQISALEPRALELLRSYSWPNNYTQFKNLLRSLAAFSNSAYIRSSTVLDLLQRGRLLCTADPVVEQVEQPSAPKTLGQRILEIIRETVASHGNSHAATARELGISRTTLWRYLNQGEQE